MPEYPSLFSDAFLDKLPKWPLNFIEVPVWSDIVCPPNTVVFYN